MNIKRPESWPTTLDEAAALQEQMRTHVVTEDQLGPLTHVAGVDCGFEDDGATTRAAIAVLRFPDLQLVDQAITRSPTTFPYVPGFLSFRELPAVLDTLEQLSIPPGVLLCDGQGIAHPRRFGIASHLGVITNLPTIGVAKTLFVGTHDEVPDQRGAWQPLVHRGDLIGAALRTRIGTRPLYISTGHRVSLATAIDIVMQCAPKYRLPETTRLAHKLASG